MKATIKTFTILCVLLMAMLKGHADEVTFPITNDGIVYNLLNDGEDGHENWVVITGFNPNARTKLTFCKTFNYPDEEGASYYVSGIQDTELFKDLNDTNVAQLEFENKWKVTELSTWLFYYATKIEKFLVTGLTEDGEYIKAVDNVLFSGNGESLISYPANKAGTSYSVPDGVKTIYSSAFRGNSNLETITIGKDVTTVRMEPFTEMSHLTAIEVAAGNKYFESVDGVLFQTKAEGDDDFGKTLVCYPMGKTATTYEISNDVEVIGRSAFDYSSLESVTFKPTSQLNEIEEYAFNHCKQLRTLQIPASVEHINVAYDTDGEENGNGSFNHCDKLAISVEDDNDGNFIVEDGVLFQTDGDDVKKRLVWYSGTKTYPGYIVPATVTDIDPYAFDCVNGLKHVVLPSGMTTVRKYLFQNCRLLQSITIPAKVTTIETGAFKDCPNLTEVFMMPVNAPELQSTNAFDDNTDSHLTLYVKPGSVDNYKNADRWKHEKLFDHGARVKADIPVKLNAYGYTTICRDFDVNLGTEAEATLCAYFPKSVTDGEDGKYLVMGTDRNCGRYLPSRFGEHNGLYQGFVLKKTKDADNYTYQIGTEDYNSGSPKTPNSSALGATMMIGVPVETDVTVYDGEYTNFGFKGTQFQRIAANGMLPYNKAYLHLPNSYVPDYVPGSSGGSSAKLSLVFVDPDEESSETTGIKGMTNDGLRMTNGAAAVYDLQGRKLSEDRWANGQVKPGIYIVNGEKVIIK